MTTPIPINLVVEDVLSEAVLRAVLGAHSRFAVEVCHIGRGYGYIKQKIGAFNNAAKGTPYFILADLAAECAPTQNSQWLRVPAKPNLLFRIAVKEIESWVLADRIGVASFLGISETLIPVSVDEIVDPKHFLIELARRSRRRVLREAIVPRSNTTAKIGPDYNGQLCSFVAKEWNVQAAVASSRSLRRAIDAIERFKPVWD